ncbi:ORF6C domain-containing protein [Faecalicatena contorta]|uniref:BRO family, N-terminal domain n=1 Tax=Faecalicatena contorta TaxID=39482 RepID=A0A315ZVR8_9FIRM|nr:ORF6C domain-containing protein [Faecalicatena contorta]PWJ49313.1 BRO family protein [Faecalicatena contorta]SUQ14557.1 BRO family, N-terminal domain [Faecalicatena contorta]
MNELQIFNSPEFGQVRTVQLNNETYFVGKDVAEALGFTNPRDAIKTHVFDEDKGVEVIDTLGGKQTMVVINESGLYALVFGSRLESAKRFKRWVTSEVLPSIRKTGTYQKQSIPEQIKTIAIGYTELEEKVDTVNEDLQNFKQDMPILGIEESRITTAVKRMGVKCLGGKDSQAYADKSLRGKVYSDIHNQLRREFGVTTYKAIKRSQVDKAIEVIEAYELPTVLWEQIVDTNSQIAM